MTGISDFFYIGEGRLAQWLLLQATLRAGEALRWLFHSCAEQANACGLAAQSDLSPAGLKARETPPLWCRPAPST